ncbi:amino acid ABC transporter substrate-binding protein [Pseudomonas japonica]|uniref:Amino acid/amide ABC transporter substrate-binding protein, HAAT family n=1 Tax=Pseudomonas japonica TaxID=256466 RepID=A0A239JIN8_9PSED|nr:amino acid ABC transporter substrate-binding protein [Pseudomonas japonica]SNT05173.1 amino acid/amide ABC transporter substrate-binding protein, HAAT family [Pseudomonas japonica]
MHSLPNPRWVLTRFKLFLVMALVLLADFTLHAHAEPAPVVIGASLPLSGSLAGFGSYQKWGYQTAVDEVNAAGGLLINGVKTPVKLVVRDDKTDPVTTSRNTQTLITRDQAVAMLGSCTPALVNAGALIAERNRVPLVAGCNPLGAFRAVRQWQYAWSVFFDEKDVAEAPFLLLKELNVATNKKIAILHDNGPDGSVIGGKLWPSLAERDGYEVVSRASFPIDNTQFNSMIMEAQSKGAEIVLVDAITPQAVAIRKQMEAAGFRPKVLVMEKGAEPEQFALALGKLSDGVLVGSYWDPSFPFPQARELATRFEQETKSSFSQHIADSYATAQILLDAISAANSTDSAAINAAIAKTDKEYVIGPVKFAADHTSPIVMSVVQWQDGKPVVIWPKSRATGKAIPQ